MPNSRRAQVSKDKIVGYLLSPLHEEGLTKRRFFVELGYTRNNWKRLADDLRRHLRLRLLVGTSETAYGTKYMVRGTLRGPLGVIREVLTVWIVLNGEDFPRLVTAYPGGAT